jgi:8-oxo-dGTP pyrophosphatase MutT (NUDIX family)
MNKSDANNHDTPSNLAGRLASWADQIRDMAATGLNFSSDPYDIDRYLKLREIAIEMTALANDSSVPELDPLRETIFTRMTPILAGAAAVIDESGEILLIQRSDSMLWNMPGGALEVGETPAAGITRETYEESGIRVKPIALVGIYDSAVWDGPGLQQIYKFTLLCKPINRHKPDLPPHAHETINVDWFVEDDLPEDLFSGHRRRITDSYKFWRGDKTLAHFDP